MKVKHLVGIMVCAALAAGFSYLIFIAKPDTGSGPELLLSISGSGGNKLREPSFAVADKEGRIFVSDSGNRLVRVFNKKGRFLFEFGGPGSDRPLVYPYGIGLLGDRVLVADTGGKALYEFNIEGKYEKTWFDSSSDITPAGVFSAAGKVYVTDLTGNSVVIFSESGDILNRIRPEKIVMSSPQGVFADEQGNIWVADGGNYNVKQLASSGELLSIFDGGPYQPLTMVKGLAADRQGRVYVSDGLAGVVRVFDKKGNNIMSFGNDGSSSMMQVPVGLSTDAEDRLYVADQGSGIVQVWGWGN